MHRINPFYKKDKVLHALQKTFKERGSLAIADVLAAPPLLPSWERATIPDKFSHEVHKQIPLQDDLRALVKRITNRTPIREQNRRFSHRDYTLLHDKDVQKPGIVALLFLEDWNEDWGGKIVFMKKGKTLEQFIPRKNTLIIVERKKGVRYFVKYVDHKAKNPLTIISA